MDHTTEAERAATGPGSALFGRRRLLQGAAAITGAGALAATLPAGVAQGLPAGASRFEPLRVARRIADTRNPSAHPFERLSPTRIRVQIGGVHVPATASAVVLTFTGVNWSLPNWAVAFPSIDGDPPLVSNLNMIRPWEVTANLVTVKLDASGRLDAASFQGCDLVVDLLGYYEPVSGSVRGGRFVGLSSAVRALDTRGTTSPLVGSRSFTTVDVTGLVPPDASSAVVNLTATETTGGGWFSCVPWSETVEPTTSSLNVSGPGETRAAAVIVPVTNVGGRMLFKIYTLTAAKLIVDVTGYYTGDASHSSQDGLFVPLTPTRVLDTRDPGRIGRLWPRWVVEAPLPAPAASAAAVVVNVTGVDSRAPGYFTVTGARQPIPLASNVNMSYAGAVVPNHVFTPVTNGYGIQIFSSDGAHAIVDLAGYFTGPPSIPRVAAYENPPPPAAAPNWLLRIPRLGLSSWVVAGDPNRITDSGRSWHWTGTGYMGQNAHVAAFAHRTEAGGPYRNLHLLQGGDLFTVLTGDRREYTYRVVRRDMTDHRNANILAATRAHPGTTFSMVACTKTNWLPTSLSWRIIVTGELVGWREI